MAKWFAGQTRFSLARISGFSGLGLAGLPALALTSSVGPAGIDALRLQQAPYNLTGRKIAIGQVEIGRPGQFGLDKIVPPSGPVEPHRLFQLNEPAIANEFVDDHANNVASVMISQDKLLTGVAPEAVLYSAAVGPLTEMSGQPEECLASQYVALQNSGDVRAVNFSFGEPLSRDPRPAPLLDGNALLTQCIDWSERAHKLLYVIAGNQGGGGIPIPTDNFNGINVAYSRRVNGEFVKVDFANLSSEPNFFSPRSPGPERNEGTRRSINIVAPGNQIEMFDPSGVRVTSSGTSFAAPHVVATVALLQEFGDRQFRAGAPHWSLRSREPMVMKSVLLNSADKLQDTGDGRLLGMSRTLLDESNRSWLDSDAYSDVKIPLHAELGTGHLNAFRAYEQLAGGQWSPAEAVPAVGWAYQKLETDQPSAYEDYVFEQPLQAGSYFSATLSWERLVELADSDDDRYDRGESFRDRGLNNLNLYLMPADADDLSDSVWSSVSDADSVEHIFYPIPETGRYKLRVVHQEGVTGQPTQPYALAWWAQSASSMAP
ncbi:S8 family serine peptidase [Romeria aff. gracilis LEGE 07310]|uniref:S8 family serine peptidase n=1 Tax=Vasconcelosia minhoensis LEGE 07310 TaxID=915328 RepID=A0A8J7AXX2_9CYAN|nr:S8 family serine peptidase [Romeria gracilis]MBE9078147.1 S8 family serine peptidase [Romeria aff. gracilis LEGE 07310]